MSFHNVRFIYIHIFVYFWFDYFQVFRLVHLLINKKWRFNILKKTRKKHTKIVDLSFQSSIRKKGTGCLKSILLACAALVHHLCSVVSRQLAESIIAVNDWPLQDLCISQQEACFWDKIQEILQTKLQIKKTYIIKHMPFIIYQIAIHY